jgi:hypothetical protein
VAEHSFGDWFFGRTPEMKARRERAVARPARLAVMSGAAYGALMGISMGIAAGTTGLVIGLLSGFAFGPLFAWLALRKQRREHA